MIDPQTGKTPILSRSLSGIANLLIAIPSGFRRITIEATWRLAGAVDPTPVIIQFGAGGYGTGAIDVATNYALHQMFTNGATMFPTYSGVGVNNYIPISQVTNAAATAGFMTSSLLDIHNIVGANKLVDIVSLQPDGPLTWLGAGYWLNQREINQIYLATGVGNWDANSWLRVLGER